MTISEVSDTTRPGLPWERFNRAYCPLVGLPGVHDSVHAQENALLLTPIRSLVTRNKR